MLCLNLLCGIGTPLGFGSLFHTLQIGCYCLDYLLLHSKLLVAILRATLSYRQICVLLVLCMCYCILLLLHYLPCSNLGTRNLLSLELLCLCSLLRLMRCSLGLVLTLLFHLLTLCGFRQRLVFVVNEVLVLFPPLLLAILLARLRFRSGSWLVFEYMLSLVGILRYLASLNSL